jgi:Calcineurin-like phosphoesterase
MGAEPTIPIELPEVCLVLVFADTPESVADFNRVFDPPVLFPQAAIAGRLRQRQLTAIDATALTRDDLKALGRMASDHYAGVYAVALGYDAGEMARRLGTLSVVETFGVAKGEAAIVSYAVVSTDRRGERGPFDIIGDVHGCADELIDLLGLLGYRVTFSGEGDVRRAQVTPPPGRRAFFAGDLVDRGPNSPDVLRIVMDMVEAGQALCVAGNHDVTCIRWLEGHASHLHHGLDKTAEQFADESPAFADRVLAFLTGLKGHLWVDGGRLAVAHAGVREAMIGRATGKVRAFSLYGDTESKPAADGLPVRYHWALDYRGETAVAYGHTPVAEVGWVNNTLCIDTGCCFGGRLTALRWPEREIVSVPARATYVQRGRPFGHPPPRPKRD